VLALAALSLLVSGAYVAAELYFLDGRLGFSLDDSWIHLAFGRALAAGEGLSIDPGRPVAGSTAPLWTACYALFVLLPGSAILWAKTAGAILQAVTVVQARGLGRDLGLSRPLAALAGVLTALTGWLAWASVSGMEVPLFTALTLTGLRLHLSERRAERRSERRAERRRERAAVVSGGGAPLSLAVLGISALARPEGLLLVALAAADRLLVFRRTTGGLAGEGDDGLAWRRPERPELSRLATGLGLALLAVLPVAIYYQAIGGSPLPTTLAVKTGHGGGPGLPSLRYLHVALGVLLRPQPWALVLAPAGAMALVRRLGRERTTSDGDDRGLLPALWLAGLPLAYACLDSGSGGALVGNFGRYLFPLFPVLAVLGVLGLAPIAAALAPGRGGARRLVALALAALVVAPTAADAVRGAGLHVRSVANVEDGDVAMARWLADRLPPEAVLATVDLGAVATILPNPIVDLAGIASPEVSGHVRRARERGESWRRGVLEFIAAERPDYLLVFPAWLPEVEAPGSPFRRLHAIRVPGNIALGGDEIVLYATPWTRYSLAPAEPPGEPR
jgi:hypothetical protein